MTQTASSVANTAPFLPPPQAGGSSAALFGMPAVSNTHTPPDDPITDAMPENAIASVPPLPDPYGFKLTDGSRLIPASLVYLPVRRRKVFTRLPDPTQLVPNLFNLTGQPLPVCLPCASGSSSTKSSQPQATGLTNGYQSLMGSSSQSSSTSGKTDHTQSGLRTAAFPNDQPSSAQPPSSAIPIVAFQNPAVQTSHRASTTTENQPQTGEDRLETASSESQSPLPGAQPDKGDKQPESATGKSNLTSAHPPRTSGEQSNTASNKNGSQGKPEQTPLKPASTTGPTSSMPQPPGAQSEGPPGTGKKPVKSIESRSNPVPNKSQTSVAPSNASSSKDDKPSEKAQAAGSNPTSSKAESPIPGAQPDKGDKQSETAAGESAPTSSESQTSGEQSNTTSNKNGSQGKPGQTTLKPASTTGPTSSMPQPPGAQSEGSPKTGEKQEKNTDQATGTQPDKPSGKDGQPDDTMPQGLTPASRLLTPTDVQPDGTSQKSSQTNENDEKNPKPAPGSSPTPGSPPDNESRQNDPHKPANSPSDAKSPSIPKRQPEGSPVPGSLVPAALVQGNKPPSGMTDGEARKPPAENPKTEPGEAAAAQPIDGAPSASAASSQSSAHPNGIPLRVPNHQLLTPDKLRHWQEALDHGDIKTRLETGAEIHTFLYEHPDVMDTPAQRNAMVALMVKMLRDPEKTIRFYPLTSLSLGRIRIPHAERNHSPYRQLHARLGQLPRIKDPLYKIDDDERETIASINDNWSQLTNGPNGQRLNVLSRVTA